MLLRPTREDADGGLLKGGLTHSVIVVDPSGPNGCQLTP